MHGLSLQPFSIDRLDLGGAGSTPPPEASQFLSRLAPEPDTTLRAHYITLITSLGDAGVWAKLDCLQVYATAHVGQAAINLISNTLTGNPEVLSGPLAFAADRGLTSPDNSTRYCTSFDPSAAGQNFALNNGFVGFWSLTGTQISSAGINSGPINSATVGDNLSLTTKWSNGITYGAIGAVTESSNSFTGDSTGWRVVQRNAASGAASVMLARNDVSVTANIASSSHQTAYFAKLRCRHQSAAFAAGAGLTTVEHTALYTALQTFLMARGAV